MASRSGATKTRSTGALSTAEELAEALLDTKFVESLAEALSPYIKRLIDDHVTARFAQLDGSIADLKKSRDTQKQETVELRKSCDALKEENVQLRKQLGEQASVLRASTRPRARTI